MIALVSLDTIRDYREEKCYFLYRKGGEKVYICLYNKLINEQTSELGKKKYANEGKHFLAGSLNI